MKSRAIVEYLMRFMSKSRSSRLERAAVAAIEAIRLKNEEFAYGYAVIAAKAAA